MMDFFAWLFCMRSADKALSFGIRQLGVELRHAQNKNGARKAPFFIQANLLPYLPLPAIMSWMIGARISSMAKPILAPGTTMVLRRDMKEFGIMFSR